MRDSIRERSERFTLRNKKWLAVFFPAVIVIIALGVSYFLDTGDGTPFSVRSTGERGASLIFDTLRHMGYPVRRSYRPLTPETDTDSVYVLLQPRSPYINDAIASEMLEWVENGGRLVFLHWTYPQTVFDRALDNATNIPAPHRHNDNPPGVFHLYTHGDGAVLTGASVWIGNYNLMNNHLHGTRLQNVLSDWHAEREISVIFFAEYYHGLHTPQNFIGRLPLVLRLILLQMVILSIVAIWFFGKRFGNPVPYYEEIEREENEYVRALARLYSQIRRKSK
ncbi:MAG: DUF4350 domain-containing protein [Defluviitaleaceae bacterium]|nr:DUF4350 domain-containing protein [Defluviitaleaceae bacterium]